MCKHYLLYAFVIVETSNKYRSKLSFESSEENDLNINTYLQAMSEKHWTVLAKLELPHFIVFTAINSVHVVGYSSRFKTQSCVKCMAHTPIFVVWNSVVNTS